MDSVWEWRLFEKCLSEMQCKKQLVSEKQNGSDFCHPCNQVTYVTIVKYCVWDRKCCQRQKRATDLYGYFEVE